MTGAGNDRRDLFEGIDSTAGFLALQGVGWAAPQVAANDKLTNRCIGVGSQGLRVLLAKGGKMTMPLDKRVPTAEAFQVARPELGGGASGADVAHYLEWIRACQGGPPARANYSYEAPIVETLLLGFIAVRTHERLRWDSSNFELIGGSARATAMLKPHFRAPWGN